MEHAHWNEILSRTRRINAAMLGALRGMRANGGKDLLCNDNPMKGAQRVCIRSMKGKDGEMDEVPLLWKRE